MATRLVELCLLPRAHSHQFTFIRYNQGPSPSSQGPGDPVGYGQPSGLMTRAPICSQPA